MTEQQADKKQAIFESALGLIRDHGFHGAPMSLVASNAGVAAGTVYHYFESKEQLICELYEYNRARIMGVIESAVVETATYKENFFNIWASLCHFYVKEPNILIFFEQFVNSPFNVSKSPNFSRGKLYQFLGQGIRKKYLKPIKPEILLVLMMGSINSTAKLQLFGKFRVTKHDLRNICGIFWDGIASPEANKSITATRK
jgi:TetR/AcrR family transcriptional repressor of multidrug resistance operon